ncbi:rRNA maturation RNase YbeY [Candidatus Mesenet endosymbiont of Agriotes lineatus]|uniref:rRNA maturation RNase YbeY n=1 Tax=Candidatus Mesenet endosymbiont of Agriotes lineatus TaxID=3077948 RepID=UPI0030D421C7
MIEISIHSDKWYNVIDDPEKFVKNIINVYLEKLKIANYQPIISILMADDSVLHKLNLEHRSQDKPTNVLSFSYEKLSPECFLGDIAISVDRIIAESVEYEASILSHTAYLILHGLLHLLGYDHEQEDEETKMQSLEEEIMAELNIKKVLM